MAAKKEKTELPEFQEPEIFKKAQKPAGPDSLNEIGATYFLISKGIDPPIKEAPLHNLTFIQLVELLNEFKG